MTSARTLLTGRRQWIAAGSMALALAGAVTQQLLPTAAEASPRVSARAASEPTVVEPSPDALVGPSPVAVADEPQGPVVASDAPVAPVVPVPKPSKAAKPATPAKPAKPAAAPRAAGNDVCSGPGWQARRGQAALATLRDTGQRSGVSVSFLGSKAGYLGLTFPERHHVDVYVRSCSSESFALLRHVTSHEMGHAFDAAHMTASLRAAYMAMRGIPAGTPWFGCSYCTDFKTPAGDFAETYSQWQRGSHDSRTQIAPMPNASQLAAIAAAFFQG